MEKAVTVESVTKKFYDFRRGEITVLDNISFFCSPGEIVGILGPNGAGKTTMLRLISAILTPTSGTIEVMGLSTVRDPQKIRTHIGFISNDTNLYERLTSEEMVSYFGKLFDLSDETIKARSQKLYESLGMTHILKRLCKNLSAGEKQKVSIARTLIHDPPILILDEPTTSLDVLTSRDILWLVRQARNEGKAILYSAHNMEEVENLCDRIILIHQGKKLEEGTIPEVVKRHGAGSLTECFLSLVKDGTS
ncbi:MAG: ATP-binding cassette domain-containing protein [Candidatus Eremiobacteraeota bacterium]|nr:ATP-binding cassette domain-containing protein [Candidatus Eremiobacteraeota bacterium]